MNNVELGILHFTAKELNVPELTTEQKTKALNIYRKINPKTFVGYTIRQVLPLLSKVISDELKNEQLKKEQLKKEPIIDNRFDMREYQNSIVSESGQEVDHASYVAKSNTDTIDAGNINADNNLLVPTENKTLDTEVNQFLGIDDLTTVKMLFNPESLYVHYYIVLDSDFRDKTAEVSTSITKFTWQYAATQNLKTGFCNSVGVIKDIVGMRMYQPRVPYLAGMDTSAKRVSVLVEEFGAQAFNAENGRRFHFLLRPNFVALQTSIELSTEDFNDGIYNFRLPITTVSSFTISFGDPLNVLTFSEPFDRFIIPFEFVCLKSDK